MVRINDKLINGSVMMTDCGSYAAVELSVPSTVTLTDEEMLEIRDASLIEEIAVDYGEPGEAIASYNLVGWISVSKVWDGIHFMWQTYRSTDINQIKQDNEDLTQAVLELAAIIGGGANG